MFRFCFASSFACSDHMFPLLLPIAIRLYNRIRLSVCVKECFFTRCAAILLVLVLRQHGKWRLNSTMRTSASSSKTKKKLKWNEKNPFPFKWKWIFFHFFSKKDPNKRACRTRKRMKKEKKFTKSHWNWKKKRKTNKRKCYQALILHSYDSCAKLSIGIQSKGFSFSSFAWFTMVWCLLSLAVSHNMSHLDLFFRFRSSNYHLIYISRKFFFSQMHYFCLLQVTHVSMWPMCGLNEMRQMYVDRNHQSTDFAHTTHIVKCCFAALL